MAAAFLGAALAVVGVACGSGGGSGQGGGGGGGSGGAPPDDEWSNCTWYGTTSMRTAGVTLTANNSADLTGALLGAAAPDFAAIPRLIARPPDRLPPP